MVIPLFRFDWMPPVPLFLIYIHVHLLPRGILLTPLVPFRCPFKLYIVLRRTFVVRTSDLADGLHARNHGERIAWRMKCIQNRNGG